MERYNKGATQSYITFLEQKIKNQEAEILNLKTALALSDKLLERFDLKESR